MKSEKELGLISRQKFKADGSTGVQKGEKTQRPKPADFGGKSTGK